MVEQADSLPHYAATIAAILSGINTIVLLRIVFKAGELHSQHKTLWNWFVKRVQHEVNGDE